jgi:phosphoribosylaminoimidazolecarboxamide formyltransferase/IMP cyclohydrolase
MNDAKKPTVLKLSVEFNDGSTEEAKYSLSQMRNGDNPHQAGYIGEPIGSSSYKEVIAGRGMSFTNHLDLSAYAVAVEIRETMKYLKDGRTEAVVINKHTNPAVYAVRQDQLAALEAALATDKKSPFGGIMSTSSKLTFQTAEYLAKKNKSEKFVLDVLAAPGFEEGCIELLSGRMKNLRIADVTELDTWDKIHAGVFGYNMKWTIGGKPVVTETDRATFFNSKYDMELMSLHTPNYGEWTDAHLAWIGAKAIQSNSFAFVKDARLLAQCGGQTNREDSAKFAKIRADEFGISLEGSAAATDSFLFDKTAIDLLHKMGVKTIVHPTRKLLTTGDLKPDEPILQAVNEYGMVMLRPYLKGEDGQEKPWRVFRHL